MEMTKQNKIILGVVALLVIAWGAVAYFYFTGEDTVEEQPVVEVEQEDEVVEEEVVEEMSDNDREILSSINEYILDNAGGIKSDSLLNVRGNAKSKLQMMSVMDGKKEVVELMGDGYRFDNILLTTYSSGDIGLTSDINDFSVSIKHSILFGGEIIGLIDYSDVQLSFAIDEVRKLINDGGFIFVADEEIDATSWFVVTDYDELTLLPRYFMWDEINHTSLLDVIGAESIGDVDVKGTYNVEDNVAIVQFNTDETSVDVELDYTSNVMTIDKESGTHTFYLSNTLNGNTSSMDVRKTMDGKVVKQINYSLMAKENNDKIYMVRKTNAKDNVNKVLFTTKETISLERGEPKVTIDFGSPARPLIDDKSCCTVETDVEDDAEAGTGATDAEAGTGDSDDDLLGVDDEEVDDVVDEVEDVVDESADIIDEVGEDITDAVGEANDAIKDVVDDAEEVIDEVRDEAEEVIDEVTDSDEDTML